MMTRERIFYYSEKWRRVGLENPTVFLSSAEMRLFLLNEVVMPKGLKGFQKGHPRFHTYGFPKGNVPWNKGKKGELANNWKGGRTIGTGKYINIYMPEHPFAIKSGYIAEHRLVVEKIIGRFLTKKEVVHHINKITGDNRIENLMLFKNGVYHQWVHRKGFCNSNGIIFDGRKIEGGAT